MKIAQLQRQNPYGQAWAALWKTDLMAKAPLTAKLSVSVAGSPAELGHLGLQLIQLTFPSLTATLLHGCAHGEQD